MDILIQSFFFVFLGEMGDKTQLLALILAARYKKITPILLGILIATLLNHALASFLGAWVSTQLSPDILKWSLALFFFAFSIWVLIPDKMEGIKETSRFGAFLTTTFLFFIAEMGDKTQLATLALAAKHSSPTLVTFGSTAGMMASNALVVIFGKQILDKIPMKWIRISASFLFFAFGVGILVGF